LVVVVGSAVFICAPVDNGREKLLVL